MPAQDSTGVLSDREPIEFQLPLFNNGLHFWRININSLIIIPQEPDTQFIFKIPSIKNVWNRKQKSFIG